MLVSEVKKKLKERVDLNRPIHPVEFIGEDWNLIKDFSVKISKAIIEVVREESKSGVVVSFLLSMRGFLIGYVSAIYWKRPPICVASHFWFMETISIKKEFRNQGYGILLMNTLMEYLKGFIVLTLCRKGMIKWYTEKIGGWKFVEQCKNSQGKPIPQYAIIYGLDINDITKKIGELLNKGIS